MSFRLILARSPGGAIARALGCDTFSPHGNGTPAYSDKCQGKGSNTALPLSPDTIELQLPG